MKPEMQMNKRFAGAVALALAVLMGGMGPTAALGQDQTQSAEAPAASDAAQPQDVPMAGPPPAKVSVGVVQEAEVQDHFQVIGRLREDRRAVVAAELSGRIVALEVEEGQVVEGGRTVLAAIDDVWARLAAEEAQAQVAQAQAEILAAQSRLQRSRRDLDHLEQLLAANSAQQREVDDARTLVAQQEAELAAAQARLSAQQAQLQRARESLARLQIVAPFDGVVVRTLTEVGQWVTPGTGVAELISRGAILARIDVPERLINELQAGEAVEVTVEALGQTLPGHVRAIIPEGGNAARTFPVEIVLDDQSGGLKPGMSVKAAVPTGTRVTRLTVPRSAVVRDPGGMMVWANLDGKAMPVKVELLFGVGDRYAVRPLPGGVPLAAGMQVVLEGNQRLFPTQPLQVMGTDQSQSSARAATGR